MRGAALALLSLALAVTACAPAATPAASPAASASAGAAPRRGGTLNLSLNGDPTNFDVHTSNTVTVSYPTQPAYNTLIRYDPSDPTGTKIIPDLADTWEVSQDGLTYTFHLHPNVKFHQGQDLTAADVKFSYERQMSPPQGVVMPRQAAFAQVDHIDAVDPLTVRVVLKRPDASFLTNIAQGWMAFYSMLWVDAGHNPANEVNGTGPFALKNYTRGVSVELTRNPNYWKPGLPYLDGIKYFILPDANAVFAACRTTQIAICQVPSEQLGTLAKEAGDKGSFQVNPGGWGGDFVNFSAKTKPFDDARVRQALAYAIDRSAFIATLREGDGYNQGFMPGKGQWALSADELAQFPGYGPDVQKNFAQAKQLLADAGYPNGFDVTLGVRNLPGHDQSAIFLKDQWANVGVNATLQVTETQKALDQMASGDYQVFVWNTSYAYDDPSAILSEHFLCNSPRRYGTACDPQVDAMYQQQAQALSVDARKQTVHEIEKAELTSMPRIMLPIGRVSFGPGAGSTAPFAVWNTLHNWTLSPMLYSQYAFEQAWLSQ